MCVRVWGSTIYVFGCSVEHKRTVDIWILIEMEEDKAAVIKYNKIPYVKEKKSVNCAGILGLVTVIMFWSCRKCWTVTLTNHFHAVKKSVEDSRDSSADVSLCPLCLS